MKRARYLFFLIMIFSLNLNGQFVEHSYAMPTAFLPGNGEMGYDVDLNNNIFFAHYDFYSGDSLIVGQNMTIKVRLL